MPVRFNCSECQSLLSVGRRKIGEAIDCPKCGSKQTVPATDAVSGEVVEKRIPRTQQRWGGEFEAPVESPTGAPPETSVAPRVPEDFYRNVDYVIYQDEDEPQPGKPGPQGPPPGMPAVLRHVEPPNNDMVVLPRSLWNMTLLAFVVIAFGAFGLGFWLGRQSGPRTTTPAGTALTSKADEVDDVANSQPIVQGHVKYKSGPGLLSGDEGAVVLAVPHDAAPASKIPVAGLRPDDRADARAAGTAAITAAGGGFQVAVADGNYFLTLPTLGKYRLLVVSKNVPRTDDARQDLAIFTRYFEAVDDLVRGKEYRVLPLDVSGPVARAPSCEFGS